MGKRRRATRLYRRKERYYADFRDFADVGGKQEAMVPPGERWATTDRDVAADIVSERVKELKARRKVAPRGEPVHMDPLVEDYARYHLRHKATKWKPSTIERDERSLRIVLSHLRTTKRRQSVRLSDVTVGWLTEEYLPWRRDQAGRGGTKIKDQTILHELHALSNMLKRAVKERKIDRNPVSDLMDKPTIDRDEAEYLEPGEAARLLEQCRNLDRQARRGVPFLWPLTATFLLTGGRRSEVFGLLVDDVDMKRGTVRFHRNEFRGLKSKWSRRTVPLWPQLRDVMERYLQERQVILGSYFASGVSESAILFPARDGGMLSDVRSRLARAFESAKITSTPKNHLFRHTYTAQRLQTLDEGHPVSVWTVACELGHRDTGLIERVYGHLMQTRDRRPVVEYREAEVMPIVGSTAATA